MTATRISLVAVAMLLVATSLLNPRSASAVFGNDYRQLVSSSGTTNTDTSVSISTAANVNYIVDPYNTSSTLTGTPSVSSLSGYGWRTSGLVDEVVPAGTWTFAVQTTTEGVTFGTGNGRIHVYAYSTDILGGDVQFIGTAAGEDLLTLLGGTISQDITFEAPEADLTGRVLVVEYWVVVTQAPLLGAALTFNTVGSVTSVQLPTNPSTTYYLSTPRLHSMGLDESVGADDGATRLYEALRLPDEDVAVQDSISFHVTRSLFETVTTSEQTVPRNSRFTVESISVTDAVGIEIIRPLGESVSIQDLAARVYFANRASEENVGITVALTTEVTAPIQDDLPVTDSVDAQVTGRVTSDQLMVDDEISAKVTARAVIDGVEVLDALQADVTGRAVADSLAVEDALVVKVVGRSVSDSLSVQDDVRARITQVAVEDALEVGDLATRRLEASPSAAEALVVSDGVSASLDAQSVAGDAVAMVDSIAALRKALAGPSESLSVSDSAGASLERRGILSDDLTAADSISILMARQTVDTLGISEDISTDQDFSRLLSDEIVVADEIGGQRTFIAEVSESLLMADDVIAARNVSINDDLLVSADLEIRVPALNLSDSVNVGDAVSGLVTKQRQVADDLVIDDGTEAGRAVALGDAISASDALTDVSWNRTLELAEEIRIAAGACLPLECAQNLLLDESLMLQDVWVPPPRVEDGISAGDSITAAANLGRTVVDVLALEDQLANGAIAASVTDAITFRDDVDAATSASNEDSSGAGETANITTYSDDYFDSNPLSRVRVLGVDIANAQGSISETKLGESVEIAANFKNYQRHQQDYAVIVQVIDSRGFTADIGWVAGTLDLGETVEVLRSWTPAGQGPYTVQVLVWDGIGDGPMPLSEAAERRIG